MTRMTTDVDALSTFLQTGLQQAVVSVLSFVGIVVALVIIDWKMALIALSVLPPLLIATAVFRAKSSKAYTEAREKVAAVNADLQENVAGMRVTQAFRREGTNAARFAGLSRPVPRFAAARAEVHRDVLPVRAAARRRRRRCWCWLPAPRGCTPGSSPPAR